MNRNLPVAGACAAVLLGAAFPSHAASPIVCNSLLGRTIAGATITAAQLNAATTTLPDHCEVLAKIDERQGLDGQTYAIRFHLRMPTAWNGRFYYSGGGGTDGNLGGATPAQLGEGYAVVTTDSGHDNVLNVSGVALATTNSASTRRPATTTATVARRSRLPPRRRSSRLTTASLRKSRISRAAPKAAARV